MGKTKEGHTKKSSKNTEDKSLLDRIQEFRLLDDTFMQIVFNQNIEGTELIIQTVLGRKDIHVVTAKGEYAIKNISGHSIRLDIRAKDSAGKYYGIEVQKASKGAVAQRARLASSVLDTEILPAGKDYSKLAESYIIFICENDEIGCGLPLYNIERKIEQTGKLFGDGSHIIYVNTTYQGDDDIGKLIHDFRARSADDMYYPTLAAQVRYYKESEGGKDEMCRVMEELREDTRDEFIENLLLDGDDSYEKIARVSNSTIDHVAEIEKKLIENGEDVPSRRMR